MKSVGALTEKYIYASFKNPSSPVPPLCKKVRLKQKSVRSSLKE